MGPPRGAGRVPMRTWWAAGAGLAAVVVECTVLALACARGAQQPLRQLPLTENSPHCRPKTSTWPRNSNEALAKPPAGPPQDAAADADGDVEIGDSEPAADSTGAILKVLEAARHHLGENQPPPGGGRGHFPI